jgi:excisionase family DNA binding protein
MFTFLEVHKSMDNTQGQLVDMPKIEKLLKGNEVARLLNVSRSFAYLLMQTGHIPTVRLGRSIRVRPQDLVEYIEQNIHRQMDQ